VSQGLVFDIREFTVHDGPGMRTTVFMKGCPLRCAWCHNPEGLEMAPQVLRSVAGERTVGRPYEAEELAAILLGQADILRLNDGGVTFSGGEPLMQAHFVAEVIDRLAGLHVVLDTSGYAEASAFSEVAGRCDLVYFDLKLIDPVAHRRWTGQDNGSILRNLALLEQLERPFVARIPLVPGVTDSVDNLEAIASTLAMMPTLVEVQLLPYNRAAGGKYAACGLTFEPDFDEDRPPNADREPFRRLGIEVRVA
jgi:pyruvate formate lyase activating enzyme